MPSLIWTPAALADVQRLYRFLVLKDAVAGRRAVKAIRSGVKVLAAQPHLGRPIADLDTDFRECLIEFGDSGYVTLYRTKGDAVAILAVRHQREAGY
ncbi:type II toxin-antitoxin system RelE/ParE family toxin [Pigmentiphaga litoralis]|uniref:type II toxin-antitoxin system RelE/ParE family toxin n=1 Tax=Pigmentiphaga litoralis TaxID=516702 RepID=UPI003B42DEF1